MLQRPLVFNHGMSLPMALPHGGSLGPPEGPCLSNSVTFSPQLCVAAGSLGQEHQMVKDALKGRTGALGEPQGQ